MKTVLVTGSAGFVGRNLVTALRRRADVAVLAYDLGDDPSVLRRGLAEADIVYHLAGVNRPKDPSEYQEGNAGVTRALVQDLGSLGRAPPIVLSSSSQAELDNPYGRSKLAAEQALLEYQARTGAAVCIYRFPNLFGKWSRPNYNTVVATFCHKIARGEEITISDPDRELELAYVDDVVAALMRHLDEPPSPDRQRYQAAPTFRLTLQQLAERIRELHAIRTTLRPPDLADELTRRLHATYMSFVPEEDLATPVPLRTDERGWLFELIKSRHFGQIFVSTTRPGVTRGNHYHDSKIEKFCLVQGQGIIRLRGLDSERVVEVPVSDRDIRIVDIPPGMTHSIENTGDRDMVVLFWANEVFDPGRPDTTFLKVLP